MPPLSTLLLIVAILLCGLTTGLVFAFTVVVMPGIRTLPDRAFLGAFKAMDRIIQNNDPLFILAWGGSVVVLIAAGLTHYSVLLGASKWLLISAVFVYLVGVQLPTFVVNVPLNNRLQAVDLMALDEAALRRERNVFESRWIFWNAFRTVCGLLTTVLLLIVLHVS